jgi:site-specific DNA-cytosine methylase
MNVLSLFDGMSCGRIALERAGIPVDHYFASEIDKYAIQITHKNYPDTIQLGDVTRWREWNLPKIDLLMGGSPCQGFSRAGSKKYGDDPRSKLFFEYHSCLRSISPHWFLFENVVMRQEWQDIISGYLGVGPIQINSALVSAQNRERLYWTNIPVSCCPEDRNIWLGDVLSVDDVSVFRVCDDHAGYIKYPNQKAGCLTAGAHSGGNHSDMTLVLDGSYVRRLSPVEWERLQTVPDGYTAGVSNTQRYKMLGNGWTVDVISHILSFIPREVPA